MAHKLLGLFFVVGVLTTNVMGESEDIFHGPTFLATSAMEKGLLETRVFANGVMGVETTLSAFGRNGVHLRQVSDGRTLVQLIYRDERSLADCSISTKQSEINRYIERFLALEEDELSDVKRSKFARIRHVIPTEVETSLQRFMPETTVKIPKGPLAESLSTLVDLETAENVCNRLSADVRSFARRQSNNVSKRTRRELTLMPGTQWCGRGSGDQLNEEALGDHMDTDRCCRQHDECPHFISAFSSNYSLFNYRLHTISHCACDDEFRTCLRMANTDYANLVGSIYFNTLDMACFNFQMYLGCAERNWWGRCTREERRYRAVVWDESYEY